MDNPGALSSPPGRIIDLEEGALHYREYGTATDRPPILLECGLGMMTAVWARLAPLLAEQTRVIAWDRPGLGWSEEREGIRHAGNIARELMILVRRLEIPRPFVLLGHSLGAMIARVAFAREPASFAGMIFLDGAHPGQITDPKARRRMKNFFLLLEAANLLASRGLPTPTLPLASELNFLPEPERTHALAFLKNARHLRTTAREARAWKESCDLAAPTALGDLPLLVITAQKHSLPGWPEFQTELAELSSHTIRLTLTDATHISLLGQEIHSRRAADSILKWLHGL